MTMEITVIGPNSGPIGGGTPVDIKVELEGLDQDTLAFLAVNFGQLAATDVEVKGYDEKILMRERLPRHHHQAKPERWTLL